MRVALLVPLMFVIVYLVAQTGAIDMSSITGFATLGAKNNNENNPNDNIPTGLSGTLPDENDYLIFTQGPSDKDKDKQDNDKTESIPDDDNNNSQDENDDAQGQEPRVFIVGGGGSTDGAKDDKPVVTPPEDDTNYEDDSESPHGSTAAIPDFPANFWGLLYINDSIAGAGETIIATINNTQCLITTVEGGYYTITVPGNGDAIDFSYNYTIIETSPAISGAVKEVNLYF